MKKDLIHIGHNLLVSFPAEGVSGVEAKIDTGADSSAVWATEINDEGDVLSFVLFDKDSPHYTGQPIRVSEYATIKVKNSFGDVERRYKVKLKLEIAGRIINATFTLANRGKNSYSVLIGKRTLHGKFIVDVSHKTKEAEKNTGKGMKIAILSKGPGNYSTKRLKEEAEKRGHNVKVINYAKCYVTVEKGHPAIHYEGEVVEGFDVVIPRISANITKYGTSIVRQFEMQNTPTITSSIAIVRSRDKLRSMQLLAKAGVGIPKTVFAREATDLEDVLSQVGGAPVIIKVARGTHGNGVVLAETRKAAKAVMQAFYVESVSFIVQEFIAESAGVDIRAFVVNGKVVASMMRQSLDDDFRSNLHQGAEGIPIKLTPEERKTAQKAAKSMGLSVCGVDMMRSERGPLVLEVNSSPGFGIEKISDKNVASPIIDYAELIAKAGRRKDKVGA